MSAPKLSNLGLRGKLAVALRLHGWSARKTGRILGMSRQRACECLRAAGVPYDLTAQKWLDEARRRETARAKATHQLRTCREVADG